MDLEAQISLITVPQEFTRLCNAVLTAEHGDDFLPIDDDRPDRGNDGYLKSEKRIFAVHCFKRVQNQSLDEAITAKMLGDLGKAIALKREGIWDIEAWTFVRNYPVSDAIAERVVKVAAEAGIDASWRGSPFLAEAIRKNDLAEAFPQLHVTQIDARLADLTDTLQAMTPAQQKGTENSADEFWAVPTTRDEQRRLLLHAPSGWEYCLYAGVLLQGREALAGKWHDEELRMPRGERLTVPEGSATEVLSSEMSRLGALVGSIERVFTPEAQAKAFGAPGEPGDAVRIENLARHVITMYEGTLDWAAGMRAFVPPGEFERAFELTAEMARMPLMQFRQFVDDMVREVAKIPEHIRNGTEEQLVIRVTLSVGLDDALLASFKSELDSLSHVL